MKKAFVLGAAVLATALVASSIDAAPTAAKPPKRWRGTAVYTYTYKDDERSVQQTVSGSVVMAPVRARGWTGTYQVSSGTIKSSYTEKSSDGCTLTSSGSYRAAKSLLVLQVSGGNASFSGSEGALSAPVQATRTCPDGSSLSNPVPVFNPFFMLTRHTAGFAVKGSPGKFAGKLRQAESGAVWTVRFSFVGQR
jgi:hypothetical protein